MADPPGASTFLNQGRVHKIEISKPCVGSLNYRQLNNNWSWKEMSFRQRGWNPAKPKCFYTIGRHAHRSGTIQTLWSTSSIYALFSHAAYPKSVFCSWMTEMPFLYFSYSQKRAENI